MQHVTDVGARSVKARPNRAAWSCQAADFLSISPMFHAPSALLRHAPVRIARGCPLSSRLKPPSTSRGRNGHRRAFRAHVFVRATGNRRGLGHSPRPERRVRCQHAIRLRSSAAGARHQCRQPRHEFHRFVHTVSGAVVRRSLEFQCAKVWRNGSVRTRDSTQSRDATDCTDIALCALAVPDHNVTPFMRATIAFSMALRRHAPVNLVYELPV